MKKPRRRRRAKSRKRRRPSSGVSLRHRILTSIKAIVLKVLWGIVAVFSILLALHPRYSLHVDERYNPHNPFANALVFTNSGYFPLRLEYSIRASNVTDIFENSYDFTVAGYTIEHLGAGRSQALDLTRVMNIDDNGITSVVDLSVAVGAQTLILGRWYPDVTQGTIRFRLKRASDGKYVWQENG